MLNSLLHVGTINGGAEEPRELIVKSLKCWALSENLVADPYELVAKKTSAELYLYRSSGYLRRVDLTLPT
ncbi:MAG: hypothetical protein QXL79_05225 [Sulfolobales archaeon]